MATPIEATTQATPIEAFNNHYVTSDEITFLRGLFYGVAQHSNGTKTENGWTGRGPNRRAFENYAQLVLNGRRRYDARVDVQRVKAEILKLMPELGMAA